MKPKKIIILEKTLRIMVKAVLAKYKPAVVAVTGSVGKTTTKETIYNILSKFIKARKSDKNYNNEIGVPLTILGINGDTSRVSFWPKVFFYWLYLLIFPTDYPKVLVLEMGADYPGDIKYLTQMVPVSVGVLTKIGTTHLEKFKNKKNIIQEKGQLLRSLPANGLAVFNYDDEDIRQIVEKLNVNSISYGFSEGAKMRATDLVLGYKNVSDAEGNIKKMPGGLSFKLNCKGKIIPVRLNHCISASYIYGALAAFSVGEYFSLNLIEMVEAAKEQVMVPGRMNLIDGIKNSRLIDDTYNSAPDSLRLALDTMSKIQAKRKIVVLGDMLELGSEEEKSHKQAGQWVAEQKIDFFIVVGRRMKQGAEEFKNQSGLTGKIAMFNSPMEAGLFLQKMIEPEDLILIKGSQGLRMEKIVEEVMAEPNRKEELLVRQNSSWKKMPFEEV